MTDNVISQNAELPPETTTPPPSQLNFLSPEFNIVDDLDDNTGNYRTFQSLDGVVTSDMRHHEERRLAKSSPHESKDEAIKDTAEECHNDKTEVRPPELPLTILSKGRTLIIGADSNDVLGHGEFLTEKGLTCTLCVPPFANNNNSISRTASLTVIEADSVAVRGCFGNFTVTDTANGMETSLSTLTGEEVGSFDLVLDLQSTPSFHRKRLPIGYYAPGEDTVLINEALAELPEMRGRFTKPQFTFLNEKRCFHGRSATHGCQRCLEICPVAAITSVDRKVTIDSYLCQGCGACALACPADAIQMLSPQREELLSELAGLLSDATTVKNSPPELVLYDLKINSATFRHPADIAESDVIYFGVEEVGRIGLEVLLVALSYGAGRVTLICSEESPAPVRAALKRDAELGKEIIQGLHQPADRIRFILHSSGKLEPENNHLSYKQVPSEPVGPLLPRAAFSFGHDKRTLTRLAAHHLFKLSEAAQPSIPLPVDSPFGAIAIDAATCSLCMACVGSCPAGALQASGNVPRVSLVESHCHQCGLCAAACPEGAIQLKPRLLCNIEAADNPVVLREVEPFKCIGCGEPFASQAMITRMQEKLRGHWMYNSDRQIQRLKMCRTCRTRDALTAGDLRL